MFIFYVLQLSKAVQQPGELFCSEASTSPNNVIDCRCGGDGAAAGAVLQPIIDTFCFHKIIVER